MNWSRSFAVLVLLAATPAAAQPYPAESYYGVIPPREVMRAVADMGLQPVSEPRLRGNVWIVRGAGREGTIVRVVLDAHSGRVVDMHSVRRPGAFGPGPYAAEPYRPDPRYVMRDEPYAPNNYVPRPGEVYDPRYPGPRGAAVPDDDDDDIPARPHAYVPPHPSHRPDATPRTSAKPETKRLASRPASVPMPKARPNDIASTPKNVEIKKEDVKKEEAKKQEPKKDEVKHEQARVPLTSPKSSEATGSIPAKRKPPVAQPKKPEFPPVQPLE